MKIKHLKKPTKQELIDDISYLCAHKHALDSSFEILDQLVDSTGGKLYEAAYMLFDFACDLVNNRHEILEEELSWFIFDNEMGNAGLKAVITNSHGINETIEVNTVEDFVETLLK